MPRQFRWCGVVIAVLLAGVATGCGRSQAEKSPAVEAPATVVTAEAVPPELQNSVAPANASPPPAEVSPVIPPRDAGVPPGIGSGNFNGHREAVVLRTANLRLLRISPDGKFVAAVRRLNQTADLFRMWESNTGEVICEVYEPQGITAAAFAPVESMLAYAAGDHSVVLQPLPAGKPRRLGGHGFTIADVTFSPDGQWLASCGHDNRLLLWNIETGTVIAETTGSGSRPAHQLRFADAARLWTRSSDRMIRWYEVTAQSLTPAGEVALPEDFFIATADRENFYGWGKDRRLRIISAATGEDLPAPEVATASLSDRSAGHAELIRVLPIAVVEESRELGIASADASLRIVEQDTPPAEGAWPLQAGDLQAIVTDRTGQVWAVQPFAGGLLVVNRDQPDKPRWLERRPADHSNSPIAASFDPQGTKALLPNDAASVLIADLATGLTQSLPRSSSVSPETLSEQSSTPLTALLLCRDGTACCGTENGSVEFLDAATQSPSSSLQVAAAAITSLVETPEGRFLLVCAGDGSVTWIDRQQRAIVKTFREQTGAISAAKISADGRRAATASADGSVKLWDVPRQSPTQTLRCTRPASALAFSPDSQWLATGDREGMVTVWNAATGHSVWSATLPPPLVEAPVAGPAIESSAPAGITAMAFTPEQRVLAVGTASGYTQTFDLVRRRDLSPVFHQEPVCDLRFADDGASLLVLTQPGNVSRWWRAPDGPQLLGRHEGSVRFAALDRKGERAVTGGVDQHLHVWDVNGQSLLHSLPNEGEAIVAGALSSDGTRAVTGGYGSGVVFWDLAAMQRITKRYGHQQRVWAFAFSPDGQTVATGSDDRTVRLWDFATQKTRRTMELDAGVRFVRFSPDGTKLVTATIDPRGWQFPARLQLWNVAEGRLLVEFRGHRAAVNAATFTPEGTGLISCGADGQVCRWNAHTGELVSETREPYGLSHAAIAQGKLLVMRRFSNGVLIESVAERTRLAEFDAATLSIGDLNVAAQGNRIIAGTEEGVVYVWSLAHE